MGEMSHKERMESVIVKREIPDKVPINPWTWLALGKQILDVNPDQYCKELGETASKVVIASWEECGYDNISLMANASQEAIAIGEASGLEGKVRYPKDDWAYIYKPYLNSLDEVDKLEVPDVKKEEPLAGLLKAAKITAKEVGSKVGVSVRNEDPWVHLMQLRGPANFMLDVATALKDREVNSKVGKMTRIGAETVVEFAKACKDAGTWMHEWGGAGATQDAVPLHTYKEIVFGPYHWINRELRRYGIPIWHHLCGQGISDLTLLPQLDADIYHITQSVNLAKAKVLISLTRTERYDRQAIAGNINPMGALLMGKPEEVEEEVKSQVKIAGEGGGYIMTTGCAMAIGTPVENVNAWVKARDMYGEYPLKFHAKGV